MTRRLSLFALFMLLLPVMLGGCSEPLREAPITLKGQIFGTYYQVILAEPMRRDEVADLEAGIREALEAVDASMSTYREDSELSAFNHSPIGEWQSLSPELMQVLEISRRVSRASDGAFDITVGGLVNLWSFGPEARPETVPPENLLEERLAQIGPDKVELDTETGRARRLGDVYVDLSAVAKGYGVDRVGAYLEAQGVEHFLVDIGGELVLRGYRNGEAMPWRVGVEVPDEHRQVAQYVLALTDLALATSGDYRNYFEEDGKRYSHTIDPRTGRPVEHALASVTVLDDTAAEADAWATALSVLGPRAALDTARREGLAVLTLERDGEGWRSRVSPAFAERVGEGALDKLGINRPGQAPASDNEET
ncbi:FAD:protein FMN transferase [Halomonas sp. YLGW01]|uniref:FAD:protein FMN transferase n=1 Tax=Halomonas sp. YLGW01 TaxID=2773308 RepID=UPI00177EF829|nr:FAD:protein FMN transferase [Halomonas sp. YLGW01]